MRFSFNSTVIFILFVLFTGKACTPEKKANYRILTAGIRHESNSFMPYLTMADDFIMLRGAEVTRNREWAGFLVEEGGK